MLPTLTALLASLLLTMPLSSSHRGPAERARAADPHPTVAPLRLGVVGLSHDHVHWLLGRKAQGDVEIVGIVEADTVLAQKLMRQYGLPMSLVYGTMREMVEKVKPTAVAAFGSTRAHRDVVEFAAPRGIHVMVEKPLAASLVDARRIQQLAQHHHIRVMVNYETTWYPTLYEAVDLVQADRIGAVRKVVVRDGHKGPTRIGVSPEFFAWLTDPVENGGGALTDFGCYGANLMTFLMRGARPTSVTAITQQLQPTQYPRVDDDATIVLTYPTAQAVIQASWNWPVGRKDMEIYGVNGYVFTDTRSLLRFRASEAEPEQSREMPERAAPYHESVAYFGALIDARITASPYDPSSLENNMIVMEILDAASRSAKTGRTIRL